MKRALLAAALTATLVAGAAASPAAAEVLPQAETCTGVWVVVDFGSEGGGTRTDCATSYSTGVAALTSVGLKPTMAGGFVSTIAGKPSKPDINKAYWSYWQATLKSDGSWTAWSYATEGAATSHPKKGAAEGWHYVSLSASNEPPGAKPPAGVASATKPTASATAKPSATASPKPTPKATTKATSKATPSAKPSATAKPSASPTAATTSAAPTQPASSSPATAAPTVTPVASATPSATAEFTAAPQAEVTPAQGSGGSPVGAIVAGVLVVLAALGLGWWFWRGRKH